jgi:uncharacterized protein YndB with AHSA1/START domain
VRENKMNRKTLKFAVEIDAPKEKVWDVLFEDETYRIWTSAFMPGSYAETDWKTGSKARFLGPEGDGMFSKIVLHKPSEVLTIEHQGVVKKGKEVVDEKTREDWAGLTETYRIEGTDGKSQLYIEQEIGEEWADEMKTMWNNALQKVKELAETTSG